MTSPGDAARLTSVAADLHRSTDETVTVERIIEHSLELCAEADHVSLSLRGRRGTTTVAASSPLAEQADALQQTLREGPALDLVDRPQWFRSGDLATDRRWPRWGPAVARLGIGSVLSIGLLNADEVIGALNLFAGPPGRFNDPVQVDLALLFGVHVANALRAARLVSDLGAAIGSRHTIGLAQGILMERYGIDQERAFEFLRRMSSTSNRKLREVAAGVVAEERGAESEQAVVGDDCTSHLRACADDERSGRQQADLRSAD
ncbi:MAG: GAF and ANTAR domain-containing protein [Marmoricola sp.]